MVGTPRKSIRRTAVSVRELVNDDDDVVIIGSRKRNARAFDLEVWSDVEGEGMSIAGSSRKRRQTTSPRKKRAREGSDVDEEGVLSHGSSKKKQKTSSPRKKKDREEEARLRVFRTHPPQTYLVKLERALSQRMFVLDRVREGTDDCPEEVVEMTGSTGNIYHVTISKLPHCTCPDNAKGNQCKHIVYVLHNVLKAPEHLRYQTALLSSELRQIFSSAPPLPSSQSSGADADPDHPSNRKAVDGDCPICFTEMDKDTESIVWCKAACGNNIHNSCFDQWARSQSGKGVTCVYCRTPWLQGNETSKKDLKARAQLNEEGYFNIGEELGLDEERDDSTYHYSGRRRHGYGYY